MYNYDNMVKNARELTDFYKEHVRRLKKERRYLPSSLEDLLKKLSYININNTRIKRRLNDLRGLFNYYYNSFNFDSFGYYNRSLPTLYGGGVISTFSTNY